MPSNAELRKQSEELAKFLEIEISTTGLKNQELSDLVSALKTKKKDAGLEIDEDLTTTNDSAYYLNPGRSITTKRGILSDGAEVKAEDLSGGQPSLDAFVKSGHVEKR